MSNYVKITDYAAKDALSSGDSVKRVKGSEIGADFDAVAVAVATKANSASPVFTGVSSFAVGAVGAPSIYMTGYATTGWYNIGANNWGFAVSGAKVLDIASTGLTVTGTSNATATVEDIQVITNATGTNASLTNYVNTGGTVRVGVDRSTGGFSGSAYAYFVSVASGRSIQNVVNGTAITSVSSAGLAVTGTLSATGTSSLARIDQSNGSITFSSLGNGSTSWQIGTQTALKPLDIFIGGSVRAQFSDTGLAVAGAVGADGVLTIAQASAGASRINMTGGYDNKMGLTFSNNGSGSYNSMALVETQGATPTLSVMGVSGIAPNADLTTGYTELATFTYGIGLAVAGTLTATGKIGYPSAGGVGSAVTQLTSKSTAVSINSLCGEITMNNATLNFGTSVAFTVNNSTVELQDCVIVSIQYSVSGATVYQATVGTVAAGSFDIALRNLTPGTNLSDAVILNFVVIKGAKT